MKYRDCEPEELVIADCLAEIKKEMSDDKNPVLIGSSLGGFLAAKYALNYHVSTLILLNPAVMPPDVDITQIKDMPQCILADMQEERLFSERINSKIVIFVGTNDEVVPNRWSIEFAKTQEAEIHFLHDDHRFSSYLNNFPEIISDILE
ncbi:MAG: hypothetical protein DRN27_05435 [Thermoplasmata archaeon]|nr:MAG: hypothetical protein DRN27_05435 [Thermoplasmata archaeon]